MGNAVGPFAQLDPIRGNGHLLWSLPHISVLLGQLITHSDAFQGHQLEGRLIGMRLAEFGPSRDGRPSFVRGGRGLDLLREELRRGSLHQEAVHLRDRQGKDPQDSRLSLPGTLSPFGFGGLFFMPLGPPTLEQRSN